MEPGSQDSHVSAALGWAEGLLCADPGARPPSAWAEISKVASKIHTECSFINIYIGCTRLSFIDFQLSWILDTFYIENGVTAIQRLD